MPLVPITEEEALSSAAAAAPVRLVPVAEPAPAPVRLTPVNPLDDFAVYNALEDEKEARGYDPADPGLASKIWTGVKDVVGALPGAARGAAKLVGIFDDRPEPSRNRDEAIATATETAGKLLGNYNTLGQGAKTLTAKAAAKATAVVNPELEPEMKQLSRRATWDFLREARDTEQFTQNFNQHLETLFPQALQGLGAVPTDKDATTGLTLIADPANLVPAGAAARWTSQVPLRGAVRAAQTAAKSAALDLAKATAERESLALVLKPSLSAAERGPVFARYQAADAAVKAAAAKKEIATKVLARTTAEQREVIDQLATAAAEQPLVQRAAAGAAQLGGAAAGGIGAGLQRVAALPEKIASVVASTADDAARESIAGGVRNVAGLMGVVPAAAGAAGAFAQTAGRNLATFGRVLAEAEGQLPFFKRLARETDGLTKFGASLVDQSGLGAVIVPAGRMAANASRGVPFAAAASYVGAGGDVDAAARGAGAGIVFGMAGAGYGQWQRYLNGSLHRQRQVADIARFRGTLASEEARAHFDRMPGADRAALATMQLAHPDLSIKFEQLGKGRPSFYYAAEDGPVAVINLDTKDGVNAVVAHEIGHHVERHGLGPVVERVLFGDPLVERPGLFTELDSAGKPVLDGNGGYSRNAEWSTLTEAYNARLRAHAERTGDTIPPRDDAAMAREVFAEHVADYMLGRDALQRDLRSNVWTRAIEGMADSSLVGAVPMLRQVLGKMGLPIDGATRRVVGSDLFPGGLPASKDLSRLIRAYHRKSARGAAPAIAEEAGSTRYTAAEVVQHPEILEKLFDGTDDVKRDARGRVVRDKDGAPVFQTAKDQKAQRAELAKAIVAEIEKAPPPGAKLEVTKQEGEGYAVPGLPDALIDKLEASGKFHPVQIAHLREVSSMIRDGSGRSALFFYQPAIKPKTTGQYASLSGDWRTETPYQIFVSKAGNVLFRSLSREKLMANAQEMVAKKRAALWGNSLPELVADVDRYLANHAAGKPGADGIGVEKRDQINALFGIGTKVNVAANPFLESSPKASIVIRSRRIDRTNRLTPVDQFFPAEYDKLNRNFRPERVPAVEAAPAGPNLEQRQAEWRAAAEKIAPGVMQRFRLEFGSPERVVQMGRANRRDITGKEEAAYLPHEKMLFLFDEALQKRSEVGTMTNLLHELGHAFYDTLPQQRRGELLDLFRAEMGGKTGPLFDDGKLRKGVARGVEVDQKEWFAERMAWANRQWAQRRKGNGAAAPSDGLVGKVAQQFRDLLRQFKEWIEEIRGEKIDVDFREFLDAGGEE